MQVRHYGGALIQNPLLLTLRRVGGIFFIRFFFFFRYMPVPYDGTLVTTRNCVSSRKKKKRCIKNVPVPLFYNELTSSRSPEKYDTNINSWYIPEQIS